MLARGRSAQLIGTTACSGDGTPIGAVTAAHLDEAGRGPGWAVVALGPDAAAHRLVPLARSWLLPGGRLLVTVTRRMVEEAPTGPVHVLDAAHERALLRHYADVLPPVSRTAVPWSRLPGPRGAVQAGDR